jgi:hypothetical protein
MLQFELCLWVGGGVVECLMQSIVEEAWKMNVYWWDGWLMVEGPDCLCK